jgi:hypothetical protein
VKFPQKALKERARSSPAGLDKLLKERKPGARQVRFDGEIGGGQWLSLESQQGLPLGASGRIQ